MSRFPRTPISREALLKLLELKRRMHDVDVAQSDIAYMEYRVYLRNLPTEVMLDCIDELQRFTDEVRSQI